MTITGNRNLSLSLSFIGGAGVTLMILALGFGVVQGADANSQIIGISFIAGVALLILGVAGWLAVVQPYKHFDDINVAQYTGHAHEAHHEAEAAQEDEHAIIPHE